MVKSICENECHLTKEQCTETILRHARYRQLVTDATQKLKTDFHDYLHSVHKLFMNGACNFQDILIHLYTNGIASSFSSLKEHTKISYGCDAAVHD